jgi:hypothetical protein
MQLYGGDLKDDTIGNLITPWNTYINFNNQTGDYSQINTTKISELPDSSIVAYKYYKWDITALKGSAVNNNLLVQLARFRFIKEDGSDYEWNTDISGHSLLNSTEGDFSINPNGRNPVGDFVEPPKNLIINGDLPPDKDANENVINKTTKKWLDRLQVNNDSPPSTRTNSVVVFILKTDDLFLSYRWATANDNTQRDPKSWTLYGSNTNPFDVSGASFISGANKNKSIKDNYNDWIELNKYTDYIGTNARGDYQGPFLMYQNQTGMMYAFNNAYKELVKIIINKYKDVRINVNLTADDTPTDTLNSCTPTTTNALTIKDVDAVSDYNTVNSQQIKSIVNNELILTDITSIIDTTNKYITLTSSKATNTGYWEALYSRIKCKTLTPLNDYISYISSVSVNDLPSEFTSKLDAESSMGKINDEANIVSIVELVNTMNKYTALISKAKIYFLIKQYRSLVEASAPLFETSIASLTTAIADTNYPLSGGYDSLVKSTVTNLTNAYTQGNTYLTLTGGKLLGIPADATIQNNIMNTYKRALARLCQIIFDKYVALYDKFYTVGMSLDALTPGLDSMRTTADANSVAIANAPVKENLDYYLAAMNFMKVNTSSYFHRLRLRIVDFLTKYVAAYTSIRSWATGGIIMPFTVVGISGTPISIKNNNNVDVAISVKGLGISSSIPTKTYSVTATTTSPKFTELESNWNEFSNAMLNLIGSSETSANTVRKTLADKIAQVVDLYNGIASSGKQTINYLYTNALYNWIPVIPAGSKKGNKVRQGNCKFGDFEYARGEFCSPDEPTNYDKSAYDDFKDASAEVGKCAKSASDCTITDDTVKAAKSTDLRAIMQLWNKYNIVDDINTAIQNGIENEYNNTILRKYKALRNSYISFQQNYGSTITPALTALDATYPDPPALIVGSGGNYSELYNTYGEPDTPGKFKDLITFIRGDLSTTGKLNTYITQFSSLVAERDSLVVKELALSPSTTKSFDTEFYTDSMKSADLAALPTQSHEDLINLMKNYALYTNQYKVRDSRYNTLVVIDHFENLIVKNKDYADIFPTDIVLGACAAAIVSDANLTFANAAGATLTPGLSSNGSTSIGNKIKRLVCDMVADIDLVGSMSEADAPSASTLGSSPATNITLEANLVTIRNKYKAAFQWLLGQLKTNMQTVFTKHKTLFDRYTEFQNGFSGFSSLSVIPSNIVKIPTIPEIIPAKDYESRLTEITFSDTNQLTCIQAIDSVRDAYLGVSGVYTKLTTHVVQEAYTKTGNFRSTLQSRIGTSLVATASKPALPEAVAAC